MPSAAQMVPEEERMLCEGCGYIVSGLPADSRCPECAKPIAESVAGLRRPALWEQPEATTSAASRFWRTTWEVLIRPTAFYRTLVTRSGLDQSRRFAMWHRVIASVLFGLAAYIQTIWMLETQGLARVLQRTFSRYASSQGAMIDFTVMGGWPTLSLGAYLLLTWTTSLAARLTAWEAAYRGLRLPLGVVHRGLHYHAANYLPVAITAAVTVLGYQALLGFEVLSDLTATKYIYFLCAEVILAAAYLFMTYWIGMKNMMFANG